jgi:hypothetical protein
VANLRRDVTIASPGELSKERAGRILFVSRALLGRQRAASILSHIFPTMASTGFSAEEPRGLLCRPGPVDYRAPGSYKGLGRAVLVRRRCLRAGKRELLPSSLVCFYLCAQPLGAPEKPP